MTEEQIQQAVDAAQKARKEFFADDPSVGFAIMRMCAKYNVEVHYGKHGEDARKEGDKYVFTLPQRTSPEHDHYRIAHEFGHIILGHSVEDMCFNGGIEISDKAVRASAVSAGAFVNLLNAEMEGLVADAKARYSGITTDAIVKEIIKSVKLPR